jgi:hypothetical protein
VSPVRDPIRTTVAAPDNQPMKNPNSELIFSLCFSSVSSVS